MIRTINIALMALLLLAVAAPSYAKARYGSQWEVTVSVRYGDDITHLAIGGDKMATDGYDNRWDSKGVLGGYLNAFFYHPEWAKDTPYFWSDIRDLGLPDEWSFSVSARYRTIDIYWSLSAAPDGLELTFIDDYTGATVDMRTQSSYTYANVSSAARPFRVVVSGALDTGGGGGGGGGGEEPPADTVPPETSITSDVPEFIDASPLGITYTGSDNVTPVEALEYSYSVSDGGSWSAWSTDTEAVVGGLSDDGTHSFQVKARDEAGNEDSTPAETSFTVDTTPPSLTLSEPNPSTLWPPNGRMKAVSFSGRAVDDGSGLDTVTYTMIDEYGQFASSGSVATSSTGSFSFGLSLQARRDANDHDGRVYTVSVTATDAVGNSVARVVTVTVPVDQRSRR